MSEPKTDVEVKLVGENGNAYVLLGKVISALKRNGHQDLVEEFKKEAMSSDYNHLLATCMEYVHVS